MGGVCFTFIEKLNRILIRRNNEEMTKRLKANSFDFMTSIDPNGTK